MSEWDQERGHASWTSAAAELGAADASMRASATVEERLLAEVRGIAAARRRRQWMAAAGIAAVLALASTVWLARPLMPRDAPRLESSTSSVATPATAGSASNTTPAGDAGAREVTTAFFPLVYSHVPSASRQIIRLRVPRMALASFGLASTDIASASSSERVLVDVVVGEDGLARAVRFVQPVVTF